MFENFKIGAKNGPIMVQKTGQKMVKIQNIYCHHFSGSKLHNKMALAIFAHFKNLGPKMSQNMAKILPKNCHKPFSHNVWFQRYKFATIFG